MTHSDCWAASTCATSPSHIITSFSLLLSPTPPLLPPCSQLIPRSMGKLTQGNYLMTNWNNAGGVNGEAYIHSAACTCMLGTRHACSACTNAQMLRVCSCMLCVPAACQWPLRPTELVLCMHGKI